MLYKSFSLLVIIFLTQKLVASKVIDLYGDVNDESTNLNFRNLNYVNSLGFYEKSTQSRYQSEPNPFEVCIFIFFNSQLSV